MLRGVLFAAMVVLIGCDGESRSDHSVRAAIVTGLVAATEGVSLQQATTFQGEIQGSWAIAYDPADPPGCTSGGLWGAPLGPEIAATPCNAFVLMRRKARWTVVGSGSPGTFVPPEAVCQGLSEELEERRDSLLDGHFADVAGRLDTEHRDARAHEVAQQVAVVAGDLDHPAG